MWNQRKWGNVLNGFFTSVFMKGNYMDDDEFRVRYVDSWPSRYYEERGIGSLEKYLKWIISEGLKIKSGSQSFLVWIESLVESQAHSSPPHNPAGALIFPPIPTSLTFL